jgi:hypothetical protein
MAVYSGPVDMKDVKCSYGTGPRVGWLGTGDASLKCHGRRAAFRNHYRGIENMVLTLALPHHGSRHNFHRELIEMAKRFVAAAGKDSDYDHPDDEVVEALPAFAFACVTEKPSSRYPEGAVLTPGTYPVPPGEAPARE